MTLDEFVVAHPDARIVANPVDDLGGVTFQVGGGGAGQTNGEYLLDDIGVAAVDGSSGDTVKPVRVRPRADLGPAGLSRSRRSGSATPPSARATGFPWPFPWSSQLDKAEGGRPRTSRWPTTSAHDTAKAGSDFVAGSGTATIPAGSTATTIKVRVLSDRVRENDEQMRLLLSAPTFGAFGDSQAIGRIVNDDTRVGLAATAVGRGRIAVRVSTKAIAANAPVKVFRVTEAAGGPSRAATWTTSAS